MRFGSRGWISSISIGRICFLLRANQKTNENNVLFDWIIHNVLVHCARMPIASQRTSARFALERSIKWLKFLLFFLLPTVNMSWYDIFGFCARTKCTFHRRAVRLLSPFAEHTFFDIFNDAILTTRTVFIHIFCALVHSDWLWLLPKGIWLASHTHTYFVLFNIYSSYIFRLCFAVFSCSCCGCCCPLFSLSSLFR